MICTMATTRVLCVFPHPGSVETSLLVVYGIRAQDLPQSLLVFAVIDIPKDHQEALSEEGDHCKAESCSLCLEEELAVWHQNTTGCRRLSGACVSCSAPVLPSHAHSSSGLQYTMYFLNQHCKIQTAVQVTGFTFDRTSDRTSDPFHKGTSSNVCFQSSCQIEMYFMVLN